MRLRNVVAMIAFMITALASEAAAQECKKIQSLPFIGTHSAVTDDVSLAQGILFNSCNQCVAEKNRIVDTESPNLNSARGIWVLTGSDVLVVNNRIIKSVFGIAFDGMSTGLYRDNIAAACTLPYSGGTNAGNNQ